MKKGKSILLFIIISLVLLLTFSCNVPKDKDEEKKVESSQGEITHEVNKGAEKGFKYDITTSKGLMDTINDPVELARIMQVSDVQSSKLNKSINFAASAGIMIGDVNGNGTIDIVDALLTAKYYVGLITEFPKRVNVNSVILDNTNTNDFGYYNSIATDKNNNVHISYYDKSNPKLYYINY